MIDHLTGDHPEFWDPEKLLRVRRDTGLIEAAVTATIRLPVVNSGFLDFGNRVAFTATARATVADATGGALVDDSEVTVRWGDLRGLHREDSGTGLHLPPLDRG